METNQRSFLNQLLTVVRISAAAALLSASLTGMALAQGTAGLLGVSPGFPQVDAQGSGQQCTYESGTSTLTIMSLTTLYFPDPNTLDPITNGSVMISAVLDGSGNPTSGTLTVSGTTDAGLSDPLLTADITGLGLENTSANPGGTDRADLRATPTGGSIFNGPDWPAGFDVTASLSLLDSNYDGSVASDWDCNDANIVLGAEFFPAPPPSDREVMIDVQPGSEPGCININGNGVVPVAILGSPTFDVMDIDQASLIFQGLEVSTRGGNADPQCGNEDVNGDGEMDLVCQFQDDLDNWIAPEADDNGDLIGNLWGALDDGTPIVGSDVICLVGKKKSKALSPVLIVLLLPLALLRRRLRRVGTC